MRKTIIENDNFTLLHSGECAVPGYLVLWPRPAVESIADLTDAAAEQFGPILRQAVEAINQVVHPERVYVICLAELEPRIHFHLFPRTRAVTETYRHATGYHDDAINGLVFMQWARSNLPLENELDKKRIANVITELQAAMGGGP